MNQRDLARLAARRKAPQPKTVNDLLVMAEGHEPSKPARGRMGLADLIRQMHKPSPPAPKDTPKKRTQRKRSRPSVTERAVTTPSPVTEPVRKWECSSFCNPEQESCCMGASLASIFGGSHDS